MIAALGAMGSTTGMIFSIKAIEDSIEFKRLIFCFNEYRQTRIWPSIDKILFDVAKLNNSL